MLLSWWYLDDLGNIREFERVHNSLYDRLWQNFQITLSLYPSVLLNLFPKSSDKEREESKWTQWY